MMNGMMCPLNNQLVLMNLTMQDLLESAEDADIDKVKEEDETL